MDVLDYNDMNEALLAEGKEPADGKQVMLGDVYKRQTLVNPAYETALELKQVLEEADLLCGGSQEGQEMCIRDRYKVRRTN